MPVINKTVFPGTSGGPHLNQIAAVGQSLLEVSGEDSYPDKIQFKSYIEAVIKNTKSLENGLVEAGAEIAIPSQNHICLVKLPTSVDSLELQDLLEKSGIITNRNAIAGDDKPAWRPGGLRLGASALTSRGLEPEQARELGVAIGSLINGSLSESSVLDFSSDLSSSLSWLY
jgi:glycine hydroxymethyltransferase